MNKNIFLLSSVLLATTATAGNDHGVMLNAKDATEPRQVEIGLPMSYTAVTVDGHPLI